jgi:tryptophanyl-tRNA synthetase
MTTTPPLTSRVSVEKPKELKSNSKPIIFSGVQPSGNLHLGNYLGALKNWVALQAEDQYQSIFCVVDLHALTVPQNPEELREKTIEIAKIYLAAGIDPEKSTIFVQSHLPQHSQLMWLLNTISKTGELFKMTQFKDKAGLQTETSLKEAQSVDLGILNYPVLMAADILLYDTNLVPVGEDQTQHVELARDLAKRFNQRFGETFVVPQVKVRKEGMRIMGLDDPTQKMSKSAPSQYNRIELLDSPDQIREKIKRAVTDSESTIEYKEGRPALLNLINIFSLVTDQNPLEVETQFQGKGYKEFKEGLAEAIIEFLKPFQKRYHEIPNSDVGAILKQSAQKLAPVAQTKLEQVHEKMGLVSLKR